MRTRHGPRFRRTLLAPVVLLAVVANTATATDGLVTWQITTDTPVINLAEANRTVNWYSFVTVTGDNQGLGGFLYDLTVKDAGGGLANAPMAPASWQAVYGVAGPSGKPAEAATLIDPRSIGGPGMDVMHSEGSGSTPGHLEQCGTFLLTWDPSKHTAGVGIDGRKGVLLFDPNGAYGIQAGTIDASALAPGTYTVALVPAATGTSVLKAELDFTKAQSGGIISPASSQGASFTFTVVNVPPENHAPTAAIFVSPTTGTAPLTVSVTGTSSADQDGDTLAYAWDFGDGQTSHEAAVQHTYATAGTFTVTLVVSDGRGGSDSKTATVTVEPAPADSGPPPMPGGFCGAGMVESAALCLLGLFVLPWIRRRT